MLSLASHVGRNISRARKLRGITQEQLGEMVGQPQSYISRIERGEKNLSLETLEKISNSLGVDPDRLLIRFQREPSKLQAEREALVDKIVASLRDRKTKELKIIANLVTDVLKAIDSKD
ncbi:helix-turn-helix domain-containing protein [Paenibacillus antarcticus]|uniref:HTH cro/C1-type domain-containing protein n=1 Tax=Paenibacillus antarcticus TaxID=253703 RepID=A0A168KAX3_9BACL|nr:helix-turn-helix transcriptional regulator [Paenibacillus antarcticus]OAB41785.1 hypothetical protein PBAT_20585 [Paenibacillus antarcticus]